MHSLSQHLDTKYIGYHIVCDKQFMRGKSELSPKLSQKVLYHFAIFVFLIINKKLIIKNRRMNAEYLSG